MSYEIKRNKELEKQVGKLFKENFKDHLKAKHVIVDSTLDCQGFPMLKIYLSWGDESFHFDINQVEIGMQVASGEKSLEVVNVRGKIWIHQIEIINEFCKDLVF